MLQTTKAKGIPSESAGKAMNVNPFSFANDGDGMMRCLAACCCLPCVVSSALNQSTGMDYWMAFCCFGNNICAARNIIRYHYRIKPSGSGEICQECIIPVCIFTLGSAVAGANCLFCCCCPCVTLAQVAYILAFIAPIQKEVAVQKPNTTRRYMMGYDPKQTAMISQLTPMMVQMAQSYPQPAMGYSAMPVQPFPQQPQPGYPPQQPGYPVQQAQGYPVQGENYPPQSETKPM